MVLRLGFPQEMQWINGIEGLWSVDPVDGTSNFFNGLPYFSISVAYLVKGKRTGKMIRLGDSVKICVTAASKEDARIEFSLISYANKRKKPVAK